MPNDKRALSQRLEEQVAKFTGTAYETEVNEIFSRLEEDLAPADTDYELLPKVVLHGDFSIRNLMLFKQKITQYVKYAHNSRTAVPCLMVSNISWAI